MLKIRAYPSGNVEFYYGDKIVVYGKDGIPVIIPTIFEKEKNGTFNIPRRVYASSDIPSLDELYNHI
jgi:hypothetical protein